MKIRQKLAKNWSLCGINEDFEPVFNEAIASADIRSRVSVSCNRKFLIISLVLALMPISALALDFHSVAVPKAVLYDAPATSAKKILLLSQGYPVEVIVNLGDWLKVHDAQGAISWVEAKQLSAKHTLMINIKVAEMRQNADATSNLLATLDREVVLELIEIKANNGWLKVRHRDGLVGYVPVSSTWGFN